MMISPADDEPDPRRNTAQIRFADIFGNTGLTEDPGDVRDRPVGADAHILVDAELDAAHPNQARTTGRQALAWFVEIRLLLVGVRCEARAQVGSNARHAARSESVTGCDFERRDVGRKRNPKAEALAVGEKRALASLRIARGADIDVVLAVKGHLQAAAEKRPVRFAEHCLECFDRGKRAFRAHDVRPERDRRLGWQRRQHTAGCRTWGRPGWCLCRRGSREPERQEDRDRRGPHFASPTPLSAARASSSPNPNVSERPGAPKATAVRSSRSSIAAGSVTPCCMIIAATPATCGVAIDVPMMPM